MTHLELYINNLKKLYPNITEEELNKMVEEFEPDMEKQARLKLLRERPDYEGLKKDWVKVVPNNNNI